MQVLPIHVTRWEAVVIAFVVTAAVSDLRWRRIPKWLAIAGLAGGLAYHAVQGGILGSMAAAFVGFAAGLALFQLGAIGGGDVKLVTALGAMLGFAHWVFAMEMAIFTAAAIALLQAAVRGRLRQTLANVAALGRWLLSSGGRKHPSIDVANAAMLRAPFGAAAALGTIVALWRP